MENSIFPTPYKLTREELLLSSAATIIYTALSDSGRDNVSISDVCEHPQYGYTASAEAISNGPRFVRITDIKGGNINWETVPYCTCNEPENYIIKKGDILVARAGSIGKSFLVNDVPEMAIFASYMIRLRAKNGTTPDYVYWFFQSRQFWRQIESFHRGSAMSNINGKMLTALILPKTSTDEQMVISEFLWMFRRRLHGESVALPELPSPMQDVQRIVAHIESLAARVNAAQRLRGEANKEGAEFFAAVTNEIFTRLTEKYHPMPIGDTFAFRLDLIRPIDGKTGKIRFVGLQHVESDTGRKLGEDIFYAEELKGRKFYFSPGEIVYGYLRPYLNKVWIADCEGVCSVDQYVIRPNKRIVDTDYLAYFMRSPVFLQRAIKLTHNLMLPRLRSGLLESILIPVPPLDEQRHIVAYLDGMQAKVNALRELQVKSGDELSALLPSVLDKAFKGEL